MKKPMFDENTESDILCPECTPPRKLIVKTNRNNGNQFLGCPNYPDCNYTRGIPEAWIMRANGQPSLFDWDTAIAKDLGPQPLRWFPGRGTQ